MKAYDPVEVPIKDLPPEYSGLTFKDVIVTFATDADVAHVEQLARAGQGREALRYLTRGFRYRPDRGDHDRPLEDLTPGGIDMGGEYIPHPDDGSDP